MRENIEPATIMVVDDAPASLRLLELILCSDGHRVFAFPSGDLALEAAARDRPDLVLLDIDMPGMDGYEVCRRLKADEQLRDVPVIFVSAMEQTDCRVQAFRAGGVDYVSKPFQVEEVEARVGVHLRMRRLQQELSERYERLQELQDLKDNLMHMIVHDLRSPLMGIVGNAQLLRLDGGPRGESETPYLDRIERSAQTVTDMITELEDVTRLEEGTMPLHETSVDVVEIVHEAVASLGTLGARRGLALDLPDEPVELSCDSELVRRVIANLLGNALEFTRREDQVRLTLSREPRQVRLEVQDHGPGIPVEYRDGVFAKFAQAEAYKQGTKYSSGLRLAFCKLAVEAHGGEIGVTSVVGQGSRIWFLIPFVRRQSVEPLAPASGTLRNTPLRRESGCLRPRVPIGG